MPTETQLTQEAAGAAIGEILAAGLFPNVTRLRQQLGGRGSNAVLQRFLDAWFQTHGAVAAGKAREAAPKLDPSQVRAQIEAVTAKALEDFEAAQLARVQELDARQARLDAGERDLLERTNRQAALEAAHEELLGALRAEVEDAREATARERQRSDAAAAEARASRDQCVALAQEAAELREVANTLATTQAELAAARENQTLLRSQVVDLTAQLSRQHAHVEAAQAAAVHERNRAERLRAELAEARVALADALQAAQTSAGRVKAAEEALSRALAGQRDRERRLEALVASVQARTSDQASALREALERGETRTAQILEGLAGLPAKVVAAAKVAESAEKAPPSRQSRAKRRGS